MKRYTNIKVLDEEIEAKFAPGDIIYIEEKIDGANMSVRYNPNTDSIDGFSHRNAFSESKDALPKAQKFVAKLDRELYKRVLGDNLIVFMEWLNPHLVKYDKTKYNKPYVFDVFDTNADGYLLQSDAIKIAERIGLEFVPILYVGPFISWEHVKSFLGKTSFGLDKGEGVVVKNQTNIGTRTAHGHNYTKIVCPEYHEIKNVKQIDEEKLAALQLAEAVANSIVTKARIHKILCKLVDEGVLCEDWDSTDIQVINKNLPREVYMDCVKEQPEMVNKAGKAFGAFANKITKQFVSEIVAGR